MSDQLKIGIGCFASHGGSGVVATELGQALATRGHEVHFISNQLPFRLSDAVASFENIYYHEVDTIPYDALPYRMYGLELASRIFRIAEEFDLDLIHVHYAIPHAISAFIAKLILLPRELRIIATLHGTDITLVGIAPSFYDLTRWAVEHCDAVTCVSKWLRQRTLNEFNITRKPLVIYNFVDIKRFRSCPNLRLRSRYAPDSEKILLHVSNFRPVKRVQDVIRTFAKVRQQVPSRLLLIGDGPERESAMEVARQHQVLKHILFLGKQYPIEEFYSIADVLLMPSEYESFGVAALEAMAGGVPVVGTRGSGLMEVVAEGETGFLCDVGDVNAMAERTLEILTNTHLAHRISVAARARAARYFATDRIVDQYETLYRAVLAGHDLPSIGESDD